MGTHLSFLFGLGSSVTVNSIVDIPTIKAWKSSFEFKSHKIIAQGFNTKFQMIYEATNMVSQQVLNLVLTSLSSLLTNIGSLLSLSVPTLLVQVMAQ